MCGISGILSPNVDPVELESLAEAMATQQQHRGPDSHGVYKHDCGVALSHRRLSILDLSPLGHQPMHSAGGQWTIVFNGEIYNFKELRQQLSGTFRSDGDTEVLLAALENWGVEQTLPKLNGMFAFAAWNHETRELVLARDRLGQKPLYYGFFENRFVFCSELHSLKALPRRPALDRESAALMLRYKAVPAPRSIYQGIFKLPPASFCRLNFKEWTLSEPTLYWTNFSTPLKPTLSSFDEALDRLDAVLFEATQRRMISDVPLGAFLSGGIDSSLIVALMQRASSNPIKTFTIGFHDRKYNEAEQAAAIASHLGTEHHELYIQSSEVLDLVPGLAKLCDEPFGDASIMPTYLLSKLTREHVTVALSGDGGDEAFGGYNRHAWLPRIQNTLRRVPQPLLSFASVLVGNPLLRSLLFRAQELGLVKVRMLEDKLNKLQSLMRAPTLQARYRDVLSDWKEPLNLIPQAQRGFQDEFAGSTAELSDLRALCFADALFYMPNDVLAKVDRASMAVSLEARSPFLDHEVFEFSKTLPDSYLVSGGEGKLLPRRLLGRYIPQQLFERPKMGFAAPICEWLRGPLVDWAEALLASKWLKEERLLSPEPLQLAWRQHRDEQRDNSGKLWNAFMLLDWLEHYG